MNSIYSNTPVSEELIKKIKLMPKVELHVHLEGATDADTIWELAERNKISLPASSLEEWKGMYEFTDFNHFIDIYVLALKCMQTPEDFQFMAERFAEQQAKQNIKYCETFLSGSYIVDKLPHDELIDALAEGIKRSEKKYGVKINFIPDISRELPDSKHRVLDFVLKGKEKGIFIGLGLGGKEIGFPPELFEDVFKEAGSQGLHVVAHAGETEGPQSIWGAIKSLKAERIGHGVRAVEDEKLVRHLRETQIPLEVSPKSNYLLKIVPSEKQHPIRELFDKGVFVTLNTDDPPMFSTNLINEYLLLASQGFTWEELQQINLNGLDASFLPEEEKEKYKSLWKAFSENLRS